MMTECVQLDRLKLIIGRQLQRNTKSMGLSK